MILEDLLEYTTICREVYGSNINNKSNNHCYWDEDFNCWIENDQHLRDRLRQLLEVQLDKEWML